MTCRDLERLLTRFADGELDERRASAVRGHARTCDACAERVADEVDVRDALARLDTDEPPASLWTGIEARLADAEVADSRRSRLWLWWQGARRSLAFGGAVALTAAALITWFGVGGGADHDDAPGRSAALAPAEAGGAEPAAAFVSFREQRAAEVVRAEARYRQAIDELRAIFAEERAAWSAQRARAFEARLDDLDHRVANLRDTLTADDPRSGDALFAAYRDELALLQDAALGFEVMP